MPDNDNPLDPSKMATVRDERLNAEFTAGFNEARAMKGMAITIVAKLYFEGHLMNERRYDGVLESILPDVMKWVAVHLLHGIDAKAEVEVIPLLDDVPSVKETPVENA